MFVRAGSILPLQDATVDTVTSATDPRVTTMASLAWLLHVWVLPDAAGQAQGTSWDGFAFAFDGGAVFTASGVRASTVIVHLPRPAAPTQVVADRSGVLPRLGDVSAVLATDAHMHSCWAFGGNGLLVVRLADGDTVAKVVG